MDAAPNIRQPNHPTAGSLNAVRHGLTAKTILLAGEDAKEFGTFCSAMRESLQPVGQLEEDLVLRVVTLSWRLRRCPALEVGTMKMEGAEEDGPGTAFWRDCMKGESLLKLARYEASLDRALHRALNQLERKQAIRKGVPVPLPMALDVTVSSDEEESGSQRPVPKRVGASVRAG